MAAHPIRGSYLSWSRRGVLRRMSAPPKSGGQQTESQLIPTDHPISSRCSIIRSSIYRKNSVETLVQQFKAWLGTMCQETLFCSGTISKTSYTTLGHLIVDVKYQDTKVFQEGTKRTTMTRSERSYSEMIRIGSQKPPLRHRIIKCPSTPSLPSWVIPHLMRCHRELTWVKMSTQTILLYQWNRFKDLANKRESKFRWVWTPLRSKFMMKTLRLRQPCRSWPSPGLRPHKINWPKLTVRRSHGGSQRWRTGSLSRLTQQSS